MALTRRQREIFDFVRSFVSENGYSPSLEEIGAHFGLRSVATVHKHVQHLVAKGYLRKAWNRSRSVEPVDDGHESEHIENRGVVLPLLGTVAAGQPIEAIEEHEQIVVPPEMAGRPGERFVLRVSGDSMIDEQIRDGDLVVVESAQVANNGDTVVALISGSDTTLKRFYRRGATVQLVPANERLEPIEVPATDVQIRGILRGLIRQY